MGEAEGEPRPPFFTSICMLRWAVPAVIAISVSIYIAGHMWGVANDCAAMGVKQDGQCGLSTAMGDLFGFIGAAVGFSAGMFFVSTTRRRIRAENASEAKGKD